MKIAIVGGGTAGWLAANHLAVDLISESVEITLIESKDVPVIGVGEGTVPHIKRSLQKFGISEAELIATCDCTLKQGIKFLSWCSEQTRYYYHPFSSPFPGGYDATALLLADRVPFHQVSKSYLLMEGGRSAKQVSSGSFQGVVDYAYHFDASKFCSLLAKNAIEKFGVKHIFETVVGVKKNDAGEILSLTAESGQKLEFDFYVDCSGFGALLIGTQMGVPFVSKSDQVHTDTVLAQQLTTKKDDPVPAYTLAKAHGAGWLWDIPLQSRRGIGLVYASGFLSEDEAASRLATHCGMPERQLSYRKIPMKIGYRAKFWEKNCVALGLAQGFVEPLEATSILVTDFSAELLSRNFSVMRQAWSSSARYCNSVVTYVWERVIDFVQLHYCISDRRDTEFWRMVTEEGCQSESLMERLEMWRYRHPQKSDFFSRFDLFDVDNYLYVLYGMGYSTRIKPLTDYEHRYLTKVFSKCQQEALQLSKSTPEHKSWLVGFGDAWRNQVMGT